jgi:hypothetical protein
MFELPRGIYDALPYDLDAALAEFSAAKEAHKLTVGVPAPSAADPLVEMIYDAGGYVIIDPPVNVFDPYFDMGPNMKMILET